MIKPKVDAPVFSLLRAMVTWCPPHICISCIHLYLIDLVAMNHKTSMHPDQSLRFKPEHPIFNRSGGKYLFACGKKNPGIRAFTRS